MAEVILEFVLRQRSCLVVALLAITSSPPPGLVLLVRHVLQETSEVVDLSQETERDGALHVAQEEHVLGQVLDDQAQQSVRPDAMVLRVSRNLAEPTHVACSQVSGDTNDSLGAEEVSHPEAASFLHVQDGLHVDVLPREQRQSVDGEPRCEIPREDALVVSEDGAFCRASLSREVEQDVDHEPDVAHGHEHATELAISDGCVSCVRVCEGENYRHGIPENLERMLHGNDPSAALRCWRGTGSARVRILAVLRLTVPSHACRSAGSGGWSHAVIRNVVVTRLQR
mmetsp:Transcript_18090/g.50226  ORF Transcript_18090/g.50226 Transcript_18090/m.50226 type:complete len:284 (+) Transcript_18090:279-1130(+)